MKESSVSAVVRKHRYTPPNISESGDPSIRVEPLSVKVWSTPGICFRASLIPYLCNIADSLLSLTRLYADDSSLYYSAKSLSDIESIVNHDLIIVLQWAKQSLVDFDPDKTETVIFSTRKDFDKPSIFFGNTKRKIEDEHKHLE